MISLEPRQAEDFHTSISGVLMVRVGYTTITKTMKRQCDRCGHTWEKSREYASTGGATPTGETEAKLWVLFDKNKFEDDTLTSVFCKKCKQFTNKATAKHFSNGFKGYLQEHLPSSVSFRLVRAGFFLAAISFIFMGSIWGFAAYNSTAADRTEIIGQRGGATETRELVYGAVFHYILAGALMLFYYKVYLPSIYRNRDSLLAKVDLLSEADCRRFTLDEYRSCDELLCKTDQKRFNKFCQNKRLAYVSARKLVALVRRTQKDKTALVAYQNIEQIAKKFDTTYGRYEAKCHKKSLLKVYAELRKAIDVPVNDIPPGAAKAYKQIAETCANMKLLQNTKY